LVFGSKVKVEDLAFGDLIIVNWMDASEGTSPIDKGKWDTPVHSVGYFLGIKGKRIKHIVIAKEIVQNVNFHYNVIPVAMIQSITIERRNALKPRHKRKLKKFAPLVIPRLRGKDGWAYVSKKHHSKSTD